MSILCQKFQNIIEQNSQNEMLTGPFALKTILIDETKLKKGILQDTYIAINIIFNNQGNLSNSFLQSYSDALFSHMLRFRSQDVYLKQFSLPISYADCVRNDFPDESVT